MSRAQELMEDLKNNVVRLNAIQEKIEEYKEKNDSVALTTLYRSEFSLCMDNSSIYEDLMEELENETDFVRRRLSNEANNLLQVEIIDL